MQVTFDASGQAMFLMPSVGASEHPVRTSRSQESEQGLKETEAALCERFFGLFGKKGQTSPNGWPTKMLKECYQAIEDLTSLQYALKWGNWGTISSGRCLTRSITAFRRTGKEYTLSDILGARRGGRVLRGCEWSIYGQRVPGWIAKEYQMKMGTKGGVEQFVTSFEVLGCPKFREG